MDFSIVLFDDFASRNCLLPLVATRPISNLRVGVLTINKKWELLTRFDVSYLTVNYLQTKFALKPNNSTILIINGGVLPSPHLVQTILDLNFNSLLVGEDGNWIAVKVHKKDLQFFKDNFENQYEKTHYIGEVLRVAYPEDIFRHNASQIAFDLNILEIKCLAEIPNDSNKYFGSNIFIGKNTSIYGAFLDSTKGPIYIGDNTVVESGVIIHGPATIGANCRLKAGTLIYSNVTVGDSSTICGELNNVVIWGNSSKGHAGYLGCAVIGEGCNLGAGTTNSNLKNDWSTVKSYDYYSRSYRDTELIKYGVIIGDHVMLGIQSMITTGTVIGVGAQIAMSKFIPKFVPDFSWFTDEIYDSYIFDRFIGMMRRKATFKNENFTDDHILIFKYIYLNTKELRNYNQH